MLDLVLVAGAPLQSEPPGSYVPVQSVLPVPDLPFKAIRVRASTNTVTLTDLNGDAETKPPTAPCVNCIGKHLVAKGEASPAGVAAGDIVREEDLPPNTRILRPTDGIAEMRTNPNRLTLIVDADGSIVDAIWE